MTEIELSIMAEGEYGEDNLRPLLMAACIKSSALSVPQVSQTVAQRNHGRLRPVGCAELG